MAKKKRKYEEVTNGVQKKIPVVPTSVSPKSGLDTGSSESSDNSKSGGCRSSESPKLSTSGRIHEPDSNPSSGSVEGDVVRHSGQPRHDHGSMGSDSVTGCDNYTVGLFPPPSGSPTLDDVDANLPVGDNVSLRARFPLGHQGTEEDAEPRGTDPFRGEWSSLDRPAGVQCGMESLDTGMNTTDCIHAMKILARFMDVCNAISDHPNADIPEIRECMEAFVDTYTEVVNFYDNILDTLEGRGG